MYPPNEENLPHLRRDVYRRNQAQVQADSSSSMTMNQSTNSKSEHELSKDLLNKVTGGNADFVEMEVNAVCPCCGSDNVYYLYEVGNPIEAGNYSCRYCHLTWKGTPP